MHHLERVKALDARRAALCAASLRVLTLSHRDEMKDAAYTLLLDASRARAAINRLLWDFGFPKPTPAPRRRAQRQ